MSPANLQQGVLIALTVIVFIQAIAFQILVFHYHQFRKSIKKPKPDGLRFGVIEKSIALQQENIEAVFKRLADLRREVSQASSQAARPSKSEPISVEGALMTLGEMNFKRRLQTMSEQTEPTSH